MGWLAGLWLGRGNKGVVTICRPLSPAELRRECGREGPAPGPSFRKQQPRAITPRALHSHAGKARPSFDPRQSDTDIYDCRIVRSPIVESPLPGLALPQFPAVLPLLSSFSDRWHESQVRLCHDRRALCPSDCPVCESKQDNASSPIRHAKRSHSMAVRSGTRAWTTGFPGSCAKEAKGTFAARSETGHGC